MTDTPPPIMAALKIFKFVMNAPETDAHVSYAMLKPFEHIIVNALVQAAQQEPSTSLEGNRLASKIASSRQHNADAAALHAELFKFVQECGSKKEAAAKLNISYAHLNSVLNGYRVISEDIANMFGYSKCWVKLIPSTTANRQHLGKDYK